jgi:Secretion system C-terminal sorting domain
MVMLGFQVEAQYYHNFNSFFSQYAYMNYNRSVFWDTLTKKVYFLGEHERLVHDTVDDVVIVYNGDSLYPLLTVYGNHASSNLHTMAHYNGDLYIGGSNADFLHGREVYMLKYNGAQWDTLTDAPNNYVTSMLVSKNRLYVNGYYNHIGNMPCNNIAYLDSTGWHCLDQGICPYEVYGLGQYVGAMAVFRDTLYLGGTIIDTCDSAKFQLIRYNGSYWEPVPGWQVGTSSNLSDLKVYQDNLYVAGGFESSDGVSLGNNIVYFDGRSWHSPGSGVTGGDVGTMTVANGKLFVAGAFYYVDGMYIPNIASWDGHQWCSIYNQNINPPSGWCASMGDTTVFIYTEGKLHIGTDTAYGVAYWTGKTYTYQCGTYYTGITGAGDNAEFSVYPNPAMDKLFIENMCSHCTISISSPSGQDLPIRISSNEVDVSDLSAGMYFLRIKSADGNMMSRKFIKQ